MRRAEGTPSDGDAGVYSEYLQRIDAIQDTAIRGAQVCRSIAIQGQQQGVGALVQSAVTYSSSLRRALVSLDDVTVSVLGGDGQSGQLMVDPAMNKHQQDMLGASPSSPACNITYNYNAPHIVYGAGAQQMQQQQQEDMSSMMPVFHRPPPIQATRDAYSMPSNENRPTDISGNSLAPALDPNSIAASKRGSKRGVVWRAGSQLEEHQTGPAKAPVPAAPASSILLQSPGISPLPCPVEGWAGSGPGQSVKARIQQGGHSFDVLVERQSLCVLNGQVMPIATAISMQQGKEEFLAMQSVMKGIVEEDAVTRPPTAPAGTNKTGLPSYCSSAASAQGDDDSVCAPTEASLPPHHGERRGSPIIIGEVETIDDSEADRDFDSEERKRRRGSLVRKRLPTGYVKLSQAQLEELSHDFENANFEDEEGEGDFSLAPEERQEPTPVKQQHSAMHAATMDDEGGASPSKRAEHVKVSSMRPAEIGAVKPGGGVEVSHGHSPTSNEDRSGEEVASCASGDSFWDVKRSRQRHKRVTSRKATGKFSYDQLSLDKLEELRNEANELEDEEWAKEMTELIAKKKLEQDGAAEEPQFSA